MSDFFSKLLTKYLGVGLISRAATTIVGSLGALIAGLNLANVTMEDIVDFKRVAAKILTGLGLMALGLLVDAGVSKGSKPEMPKPVSDK